MLEGLVHRKQDRARLTDRLRLLVGAALLPAWQKAIVVVQPETWTAQQLRNATMDGDAPKILLRDRDDNAITKPIVASPVLGGLHHDLPEGRLMPAFVGG